MATLADWDKNADGSIAVKPLVGIDSAPMRNGMAALLRISYLTGGPNDDTAAVQLAIAYPEVARLIAELQALQQALTANLAADVPPGAPS